MRKLGISIYPEKMLDEEIFSYIELASKYGFSRLFSCLISTEQDREKIEKRFKKINQFAKSKGFEIIIDISPSVFNALGISYKNLSFFKEICADGIRLDQGFSGAEEALMTFNEFNLKIEINMSNYTHTIDTIMDYMPNVYNLYACFNFYPHEYSAHSEDFFIKCSKKFKKYGLRTAAFISSQTKESFGPWPVSNGLPTLESHRYLPIEVQAKHLISLNCVDDIIISNCYASEEELEEISKISKDKLSLKVDLIENIPEIEKTIVLEHLHFNRGDSSDFMLRSTQPRVIYKGHNFEVFNAPEYLEVGDVIIESSLYGHYAGELQVIKKRMKNSGKTNLVARIRSEEIFLIYTIKAWQKFNFVN